MMDEAIMALPRVGPLVKCQECDLVASHLPKLFIFT